MLIAHCVLNILCYLAGNTVRVFSYFLGEIDLEGIEKVARHR